MSWHPNDLVADADLSAYEQNVLTRFGQSSWTARRTKALEDWLFPILKGKGFDPFRLRTRFELAAVLGYTGAAYSDKTDAAKDTTADDIDLAAVFATPGSDYLYVGSPRPFRGVFVRMADSVSAVAGTMTVEYWNGSWASLTVTDGTEKTSGKPFSGGGSVTWDLPVDWATRKVNSEGPYYWARVSVDATPTSATAGQIGAIQASSLRAPATLRTLALIFREAPTGSEGPWESKAAYYESEADAALQRALEIVGGEFDTDETDLVSEDERGQTAEEAGGRVAIRLERG